MFSPYIVGITVKVEGIADLVANLLTSVNVFRHPFKNVWGALCK